MSLLPLARSPFPSGAPADGSAARPYITTTAGAAGLASLESTYTIKNGDTGIIDAAGDPIVYRAVVIDSAVHWYAPVLGGAFDDATGLRLVDPSTAAFTEVLPSDGNGAIDFDTTVANRIALRSGTSAAQSAMIASTLTQDSSELCVAVLTDLKVAAVSGSAADFTAGFIVNTTAGDGGGVGLAVYGDRDEWKLNNDYVGATATTENTIEVSFDLASSLAWVRLNRGATLQRVGTSLSPSFGTSLLTVVANYADSAQRTLSFSSAFVARLSASV